MNGTHIVRLHIVALSLTAWLFTTCSVTRPPQQPSPPPSPPSVATQPPTEERPKPEVVPQMLTPSRTTVLSISPYPSLKARLDSLIPDDRFPPAHIGLKIVSLSRGETLYELNAQALFNPASGQKLITAATALTRLGSEFLLKTIVYLAPESNTLYVKGFGDPLFRAQDADTLARILRTMLSPALRWRLVGDVSYFDDQWWGYGWNWNDEPEAYQMYITPLILHGNAIKVFVRPGRRVGDPLIVRTEPPTQFVSIENNSRTTARGTAARLTISRRWRERSNIITVEGEMARRQREDSAEVSIWQPERYALYVIAERMQSYGITVSEIAIDTIPHTAIELARTSHRLDSVVTYLNKESDNLSGEALIKILGAEFKGTPGSAAAGASVIKEYLAELGIDTTWLRIVDGSGLSRHDLLSPAILVRVLEAMYTSPHFDAFYHSLPIAGVDGTIRNRMKYTGAHGNLRAKTGTLSGVSSLSGYALTADGEWLAFSMMMMNYPTEARVYRRVQDQIAVFLSGLRRAEF